MQKSKLLSCNGRVNGVGDATFKCMNAGFNIVMDYSKATTEPIYTCDACKKKYTLNELLVAQTYN